MGSGGGVRRWEQVQENHQDQQAVVVSLCLYNEHIAPNRKSSSGPLGWTCPAQEWREGG